MVSMAFILVSHFSPHTIYLYVLRMNLSVFTWSSALNFLSANPNVIDIDKLWQFILILFYLLVILEQDLVVNILHSSTLSSLTVGCLLHSE